MLHLPFKKYFLHMCKQKTKCICWLVSDLLQKAVFELWYEKTLSISLGGFKCFSCNNKSEIGRKSWTN